MACLGALWRGRQVEDRAIVRARELCVEPAVELDAGPQHRDALVRVVS